MLTINVAVLLAFIVVMRLRRRTEARSRMDERFTVVIVLALGVLIAPTEFGQGMSPSQTHGPSGRLKVGP
ncbi:hypothetical protein [Streptomyces sp. NPDC014623]|uniref:hypothetical protein n=1 Tax=Streptomyces sp. NPDC014623 TaxID=3364875 RepID=UPI0036FBA80E